MLIIEGKYYKLTFVNRVSLYYFIKLKKFELKKYDEYLTATYSIKIDREEIEYSKKTIYTTSFYNVEEIMFEDIVDLLPDTNIDKISYFRKEKIKFLLKC